MFPSTAKIALVSICCRTYCDQYLRSSALDFTRTSLFVSRKQYFRTSLSFDSCYLENCIPIEGWSEGQEGRVMKEREREKGACYQKSKNHLPFQTYVMAFLHGQLNIRPILYYSDFSARKKTSAPSLCAFLNMIQAYMRRNFMSRIKKTKTIWRVLLRDFC